MTDLHGCVDCGHKTSHLPGCPRDRSPISQIRLGGLRERAERFAKPRSLSLSAVVRLALAEWLERNGG